MLKPSLTLYAEAPSFPLPIKVRFKRTFSRLTQRVWPSPPVQSVRFLMYHSIVENGQNDPEQMTTPVALFEAQMAHLASSGYRVEPAALVAEQVQQGRPLAERTVVLTFDDGFADNYDLALPILCKYRFPATVFLISSTLHRNPISQHHPAKPLTWDQIRKMQETGLIQFGCHGATHRTLSKLASTTLLEEIQGAKQQLEERLTNEVKLFAYPYGTPGSWNAQVRRRVEEAGFQGALTSIFGFNTTESDCFLLKRSRVSWCDDIPSFDQLLQGACDWYAWVQRLQSAWGSQ